MIKITDFSKMLSGELEILRQQTDSLSHEDSLLQPQPGGNCLNWVIGHLVGNLVEILKVLGSAVPENLPNLTHYGYGSDPIRGDEEGVIPLQLLINAYELLTESITERLNQMSEPDFKEEIDFFSRADKAWVCCVFLLLP